MSDIDNIETKKTETVKKTPKKSVNHPKRELNEIYLSPAPHFATPVTVRRLMLNVVIALLPIAGFAVYLYGLPALLRLVISVISTVVFESVFRLIVKRPIRAKDFSAVITGLLLALVMPSNIPIWILILSAFFAIVVGKEFFGGLGKNPFNPALIGRAFAFVSFAGPMTSWITTKASSFFGGLSGNVVALSGAASKKAVDLISTATVLSKVNPLDGVVLSVEQIASELGLAGANDLYLSLFFGNRSGSMGESPIFLILIAFVFLILTKTIDWRIPVSMLVSAALSSVALGFLAFGTPINPLLTLLSGGLVFGAVFMATDYATSPVTPMGRIIFGAGCGFLSVVIRLFGTFPEGVMFSILIMNALVPYLNKILPKKYGYVKGGK